MFKNIQKYLLLNYPLLWNTKVVPAVVFTLIFNVLFFAIGHLNGTVDFSKTYSYDYGFDDGIIIFFSVVVSILLFIIWFVYYARNNAFKSYYPMKIDSLYKEWLIIFLVSVLNITYTLSYYAGKTINTRTLISKDKIEKRNRTIEMASVFVNGTYENYGTQDYDKNGELTFQNKKYKQNSLINKSVDHVGDNYSRGSYLEEIDKNPKIISSEIQVKTWMQNDNQVEIKKMMRDYFDLIQEHHLVSNLTPEKWFALTYHFPNFMEYENIGREKPFFDTNTFKNNSTIPTTSDVDSTNIAVEATVNLASDYDFYVPHNNLKSGYDVIAKAWDNPIVDLELLRVLLYLAIGFSLLLFSFKVTSSRSWIIAIVCVGLLWIMTGLLSILSGSAITFIIFWIAVISFLIIYFVVIITKNKGKKISDIILNLLLWSFAGFLPAIYSLAFELTQPAYNGTIGIDNPKHTWLVTNLDLFYWINILIVIIVMFFFSINIKKWKGIAES